MDQQATFAAVIALSAACAFAVSNALQHRAASGVPRGVRKVGRVLLHLARNPWWLVGTGLSFIGMLLHATALSGGSLAFVQPLLLVGLVLAIPVRAALERKLPLSRELRAVAITAVGLAIYLSSVTLAPGERTPRRAVAIAMVVGGLLLAMAAVAAGRRWFRGRDRLHAGLLGAAAGCLFGISAGMLKLVGAVIRVQQVPFSLLAVLVLALATSGIIGTAINQRAYQIAPLAFSMPVVNVVGVLIAIVFGGLVFGEVPGHSPGGMAVQLLGLGVLAVGLREIARLAPTCEEPKPSLTPQACAAGAGR
jgi:drug/metabolite transporter (DMT)-like permease